MNCYHVTPNERVIVITGAARGIGKTIAKAFAQEGSTVIIADINQETGNETAESFKKEKLKAYYLPVDLSIKGAPQALIKNVAQEWGRIDVLVNNVRAGKKVSFEEELEDNWNNTLDIILRAAFYASREAMKIMQLQGTGSIINIGSVLNKLTISSCPAYQVAKAGLTQLTRYLALQGGKHGIRVNTVSPGLIIQEEHIERFNDENNSEYRALTLQSIITKDVGESNDIAETILFLANPKSKFITGQEFIIDEGSSIREHFEILQNNAQNLTITQ